jgi:glutamyl/glutaminyl-tRNA synthetase
LIKEFSLENVQKGGAIFNTQRLDWINGVYIRNLPIEELTALCIPYIEKASFKAPPKEQLQDMLALYQERLKKLSEIPELIDFFLKDISYDKELLSWKGATPKDTKASLAAAAEILNKVADSDWNQDNLSKLLLTEAEKDTDRGKLLWPLRVALTGKKNSASPFEVAAVLRKEQTLQRIQQALSLL